MNDLERNAALHARLDALAQSGQARVVPDAQSPGSITLTQRFAANRQAGRPLLDGLTAFRGSKDPDVDTGTFDAGFKHATLLPELARGYAALANQKIGLIVPAAQGIGVMAEYALPADARFVGNFGLENGAKAADSLSVAQVEERLTPLVDAYLATTEGPALDQALTNLHNFYRSNLYELAVPAQQQPLQRWVVQLNEAIGVDRLIEHASQGPLSDVLVDVVRERKLAVDAHGPARIMESLRRGSNGGLAAIEDFAPGSSPHLLRAADRIEHALETLREQAYATPMRDVEEALTWRRDAQKDMQLSRLTNSGINLVFEHTDPRLKEALDAQSALHALDSAAHWATKRPHEQAMSRQLDQAHAMAQEQATHKATFEAQAGVLDTTQGQQDKRLAARDTRAERLTRAQKQHNQRRSANLVSRLLYRFGDEKKVLADLTQQHQELTVLDRKIETRESELMALRQTRDASREALAVGADRLREHEQSLRNRAQQGDLDFLPEKERQRMTQTGVLQKSDWEALLRAAQSKLQSTDQMIALGRQAAQRIATLGQGDVALPGVQALAARDFPRATVIGLFDRTGLSERIEQRRAARIQEEARHAPSQSSSARTLG